jgi:hypothetical protein
VPGESTESINLTRIADQPGRYEGTWTPRKPGTYRAKIELAGHDPGATLVTIATSLRVDLPGREMSQVWMNRPLLRELASLSGGKYFDADQTDELAAAIPDRTETVASKSPPRPLWDTGGMLTVLVGLLCTEWLLRKSFRLL